MLRLSRQQVRQVDRLSVAKYKIPSVILMENAARTVADVACGMLGDSLGQVLILCGGGNNGGDGLAAARHLHNRGADVAIMLTVHPSKYAGEAKVNWDIVEAMKLKCSQGTAAELQSRRPALIIDAIFGTGLSQPPREASFAEIVAAVTKLEVPVLAVDIPSGMDCDTGKPLGACIVAKRTVTFVAEKIGFANPEAKQYLGEVTVADIGCPRELVANPV
jgi:NAD(P)H-hydrate epimerase